MTKDEIFNAWAPDESIWSPWTKPVLFAHLNAAATVSESVEVLATPANVNWCPLIQEKIVVVVDLPGAEGVRMGLMLAERGYRPVPLYNAIPLPDGQPILDLSTLRNIAAVNVLPIADALRTGAERLIHFGILADASPVFLLDANRQGDGRKMAPDEFDNRSVCFTSDFPSANFLLAHGFQRVLLVQKAGPVAADLSYVLRRWQDGGLTLEMTLIDSAALRQRLEISRPSWFGAMFQRALLALGLRPAVGGGFGAWVPESSAGG